MTTVDQGLTTDERRSATDAGRPTAENDARPPSSVRRPSSAVEQYERPVALILIAAVFSFVQAGTYNVVGVDGYYHIKVAALIREHGPRLDFPWLRFTILNEAAYSDHHLLFHILQAPFTLLDLRVAAKLSATLFATLAFFGIYAILARSRVRWPLGWLLLMLALTHAFLWRHAMARPQSLALLLMVAVIWVIFERRLRWLVPLGFLSAWLFDGFILTLTIPAAAVVAGLFVERRLDWRPLAYLGLGTALGLLIHPYFPRNVVFAALHLLPKSGFIGTVEVPVGGEWSPYPPAGFARRVGPALAVMVAGLVPLLVRLWRRQPPRRETLTLALLALGFLALQDRSQRIIEYYPAFAVLLAAWSWSFEPLRLPAARAGTLRASLEALWARRRAWFAAAAAAPLLFWLAQTVAEARRTANAGGFSAQVEHYRDASLWLAANSPPGALVFNVDWDDFPQLFFWNHRNVYVSGLDPTYLALYDPELYSLWRRIEDGNTARPSVPLRERFGAAYAISDTRHPRFLANAAADPGLEEVFRSDTAVVFRVR